MVFLPVVFLDVGVDSQFDASEYNKCQNELVELLFVVKADPLKKLSDFVLFLE